MSDMIRELRAHELRDVSGGSVAFLPLYVLKIGGFGSLLRGAVNNAAGAAAADAPAPCPAGMVCT